MDTRDLLARVAPHQMPRTPMSFRERVLYEFRSERNVDDLATWFRREFKSDLKSPKLQFLLRTLRVAVDDFSGVHLGQGGELVDSDPLAIRGSASRSGNIREELYHLNSVFFHQRMRAAQTMRWGVSDRSQAWTSGGPGEVSAVDSEPLYYRMFVNQSLRPKGLTGLNNPGPSYNVLEDQNAFSAASAAEYNPSVAQEDHAWSAGKAGRTAEDAMAEYYGADSSMHNAMGASDPHLWKREVAAGYGSGGAGSNLEGTVQQISQDVGDSIDAMISSVDQDLAAKKMTAATKSASRWQRYPKIPFWQKINTKRPEIRHQRWQSSGPESDGGDFEETLGSGSAEFGGERENPQRGWNMDRARAPRGESYMQLGYRQPYS